MPVARIYRPAKNAMQSGRANSKRWVLEYEPATPREIDPLMGWTSALDTSGQVKMRFDTKEDAIRFADKNGIAYRVSVVQERTPKRKSYADNFRFELPE